MKKQAKQVLAAVCAFVLVLGSGLRMIGQASDTNADAQTEWMMYSGEKESIITDEGHLVVSVENAGVDIPDTLEKRDLGLSVTLTIPNEVALNSMKTGVMEIAQDICDEAEISWELSTQNLTVGQNVIELALVDGIDTGVNMALNIHETINWFRIYSITNPNGNTITLQEVKLVDTRTPGILFGEEKTYDTYLQLTDTMDETPQRIEASVKIGSKETTAKEWILRLGTTTTTTSGHTLPTGVTTETDAPGAGMTYGIYDATSGAQQFTTNDSGLSIDVSQFDISELAVAFWVYSNESGSLTAAGDNQMRISSSKDGLGANFIHYPLQNVSVVQGWNYIELPLSDWKEVAGQPLDLSDIKRSGFTPFMLSEGSVRYIGTIKLIVMEADVDIEEEQPEDTTPKWTLRSGSDKTTTSGYTLATGTTTASDAPGAGMTYSIVTSSNTASSSFNTLNTGLGIDASEYKLSDLAVAFWVYAEKAGTLGTGDNMRLGNMNYLGETPFLHYNYVDIPVEAGWNYIVLPLDEWRQSQASGFSCAKINCFGFTGFKLDSDDKRYFGNIELIVLQEEGTKEWSIRSGKDTTTTSGYTLTTGVTSSNDAPGAGMTYSILTSSNTETSGFNTLNTGLEINASGYEMSDLAVAFWVYAEKAGTLGTGDNMRLGNKNYLGETPFLHYNYVDIPVEAGWNYIVLPLDEWKNSQASGFSCEKINCFGFTNFKLNSGDKRYFGDIKLIVLKTEPITSVVLRAGSDTTTTSGHTIATGTTVAGDKIGADKAYNILSDGSSAISGFSTMKTGLGINASASEMSDLAVAFWVYSNEAGKLGTGDQFRIGSGPYMGTNALIYYFQDIEVEAGWNYIELPLDTWKTDIKQDFTLKNIDVFGYSNYNLTEGQIRYIADIQLINKKLVSVEMPEVYVDVTKDVSTVENNYMIFSNVNAENESNPYALFITDEGYPSLLYGTTQFTLTQDVRTGDWVDLAVERDDDGFISFYVDGAIVARSDMKVAKMDAPDTAYCIGADGMGAQIMDGYIANVRTWNEEELTGNWLLLGDIQDVLETLPDASDNKNDLVYRGSRADDWIDYEIPTEIGEDYWSIVFVPDIQNLIRTHDYNKTWEAIGQWIADNAETENIQHVIGAGDSSWNATEDEFERAMKGFDKFMDLVPTNVIIGNHDYHWGTPDRVTTNYLKYFGEEAIKSSAAATTYVGYYDDPTGKSTTENSYYRFSINGVKWMILQLEYHPRVSVMEWAEEILETYADDNVIVTTHAYIDGYGEYASNTYMEYTQNDANVGGSIGETSEAIWNEYLYKYTNIKMILCGHKHNGTGSVVERIETNIEGQKVPALMINAQDVDAGDGSTNIKEEAYYDYKPIGMLGILRFSADGTNVALQYYAPTSEKSFSPEDPFGNADSNNLVYTLDVAMCSHTDTTVIVNADAVTGITDGYTGDEYCTDCDTMVSTGTVIPATGEKQETLKDMQQDNQQDAAQDTQKDTEQDSTQTDADKKDSPQTGDATNLFIWFVLLVGAAVTVYSVRTKIRKEEE